MTGPPAGESHDFSRAEDVKTDPNSDPAASAAKTLSDTTGTGDREGGPHKRSETVQWTFPNFDTDDDRSPADMVAALREDDAAFATGGPTSIQATSSPGRVRIALAKGDETLLDRIELDLANPTTASITDTVRLTLLEVNGPADAPYSTEELWPPSGSGDAPGRQVDVTLGPDETTTLAIAGDAGGSITGFVDSDETPLPDVLALPDPPVTIHIETELANATDGDDTTTPLTLERTRPFFLPATYLDVLWSDGRLERLGPRGEVRERVPPGGSGVEYPGGIAATNRTYDSDETGTADDSERLGGLAPTAYLQASDYDADGTGVVDNSEALGGLAPTAYLQASDYDADGSGTVDNSEALGGRSPEQYLRSDTDDETSGVLTHTANGDYDQTIPRGDGEAERWDSSLGGFSLSITGGHGRVAQAWGAIYDSSNGVWRYTVDNEAPVLLELDGGEVEFSGAPGGTAGDPIDWNTVEYRADANEFLFNGATTSDVVWNSGSSRPSTPVEGQRFFDSDLGQPIWYDGSGWVDAQGASA
jgi:hypothetical protein